MLRWDLPSLFAFGVRPQVLDFSAFDMGLTEAGATFEGSASKIETDSSN